MAAVAPTKQAITGLYNSMLKTSQSFSSYNFREYFLRRTKDTFKAIEAERDPAKLSTMYSQAVKDHVVLRRSAVVNQLYGGWKVAVEVEEKEAQQEVTKDRGDT
ncbi:hypothetical protein CPB83DRAFT_762884 [Crepidotus variabilis]|uniref:Complex 1 LYR protein domain-containing protein n=1 Tax=Crepidotus variabilis TaxID=179855 RepID=A0A9P6EK78_9AGAR|nr:hypothetical protein CPB83DRAFT_762884 [Crepidotus variabilis]